MSDDLITISVPQQGVDLQLTLPECVQWVDSEIQFVNEMSDLMGENFSWNQQGFHNQNMHQIAARNLQNLRQSMVKGDLSALNAYLEDARSLPVVLGSGSLGATVRARIKRGEKEDARWLLLVYGGRWTTGNVASMVAPFRMAAIGNPSLSGTSDIISAKVAKERATEAQILSKERAAEVAKLLREKESLFSTLEEKYRERLTIAEPASYWEGVAAKKKKAWLLWLSIFGILAVCPFIVAALTWEPLTAGIARVTNTSNSVISISALAAITIPALLYGWVLKNVGRIFLQNLMLSDDAEHRRALALTYLGLMANPKHGMEREDRAIILNALFRPIPPHSGEEGPPSGLVELIKGKAN